MAHELNFQNGKACAWLALESAWHDLGHVEMDRTKLKKWEDIYSIIKGFNVSVRQLEFDGSPVDVWATFRDDTNVCLGPVSKGYQVMQLEDIFKWVDPFVQAHESHHYESAIILGKGERVAVQVRVPEADFSVLGKDEHRAFVTFATSFDRSWAHNPTYNTIRVVCANTARFARQEKDSSLGKVRHSSKAQGKLVTMRDTVLGLIESSKEMCKAYEELAQRTVTKDAMETILERLFPTPEKRSTRRYNTVQNVLELFESNDKDAIPEARGTAYNLLNAIIEHVDYHSGTRKTENRPNEDLNRAENAVFGKGADFKEQAFEVIYEAAQSMPYKNYITRAIEKGAAERANDAPVSTSLLDSIIDV